MTIEAVFVILYLTNVVKHETCLANEGCHVLFQSEGPVGFPGVVYCPFIRHF